MSAPVLEPILLLPCGCLWVGRFDGDHPWLDESLTDLVSVTACGCEWVGPRPDPATFPIVGGFCACCSEENACVCDANCSCFTAEAGQ